MLLFVLVFLVSVLFAFLFGVIVGIKDCKRTFNIPYGVTCPEDMEVDYID